MLQVVAASRNLSLLVAPDGSLKPCAELVIHCMKAQWAVVTLPPEEGQPNPQEGGALEKHFVAESVRVHLDLSSARQLIEDLIGVEKELFALQKIQSET